MKLRFTEPTTLLTALAVALTAALAQGQDTITLNQALPVGKKIHQSMEMNQKMKMGGIPGAPEGQGMNMTNQIGMDMSMDVKKDGEGKKAVVKYERMRMLIDAGVFKQEFDSNADDGNPFTAIVGKEMTLVYDKDDELQSVEGVDELLGDAAAQPGAGQMLQQLFSKEQMEQMVNQSMLHDLPDGEIKVGDKWDFKMEQPMPQGMGKLTVTGNYTLKRFEDLDGIPCAVIAMEGKFESEGKSKMNMNGQEIEMEFTDSKFEGDIYFDNKLGLPRKSDMLTKMKMKMGLLGQTMTMDMNMTMINKVTKVEDSK